MKDCVAGDGWAEVSVVYLGCAWASMGLSCDDAGYSVWCCFCGDGSESGSEVVEDWAVAIAGEGWVDELVICTDDSPRGCLTGRSV